MTVTLPCGKMFNDCFDYFDPYSIECILDDIDVFAKDSCDPPLSLDNPHICFNTWDFAMGMSDLLPIDPGNRFLYLQFWMENDGPLELIESTHIVRTVTGQGIGGYAGSEFCIKLEPHQRDHFNIVITASFDEQGDDLLCTYTISDITFGLDGEGSNNCSVVPESGHDSGGNAYLKALLNNIGLGSLPLACQCVKSCTSLPEPDANQANLLPLRIEGGGIRRSENPCQYREGMSIWCGDNELSTLVIPPLPGVDPTTIVQPAPYNTQFPQDNPAYNTCNMTPDPRPGFPDNCIYECGCRYEYIDQSGDRIEVVVPSQISLLCPDDSNCPTGGGGGPGGGGSTYDCYDIISEYCVGANNIDENNEIMDACDIEFTIVEEQDCASVNSFCPQCFCEPIPPAQIGSPPVIESIAVLDDYVTHPLNPNPNGDGVVGFICKWRLVCLADNGEPVPQPDGTHFLNTIVHAGLKGDDITAQFCYVENELYGICGDCAENFPTSIVATAWDKENFGLKECTTAQLSSDCAENVIDPDGPITGVESDPNFPPNGEPKSIVYSEQNEGPYSEEEEIETYIYSGFGTEDKNNSQNYFYMQSSHVSCDPVLQFDYCGDNSVYWTTKLNVNGEGAICGTSNMFWRSGWCACPNEPNMSFGVGWLNGQIEDHYIQSVDNKSTSYLRKTKGGQKSSLNKDIIVLGTDATGVLQTTETYGGPGDDVATSITPITLANSNYNSNNGGFAMTGYFDSSVDFSGDGSENLTASGIDAFVAIFDSNGSYLTSINNIVDGYEVRGKAISSDSQGDFILVLSVRESANDEVGHTMIVKLSAALDVLWELPISGSAHSIDPGNVMIYNNDNIVVAGSTEGVIQIGSRHLNVASGMHAGFIVGITKLGVARWIREVGISNDPIVLTAISEAQENEFYISGYFTDDVDIAENTLEVGVEATSFISKYTKNGVLKEIHSLGSEGYFKVNDMNSNRKGSLAIVGTYAGDIKVGNFDLPNEHGEERGFFIPLTEILNADKPLIQNNESLQYFEAVKNKIINVFPNPFKQNLNIEFVSEQEGQVHFEIFYLDGKSILRKEFEVYQGLNQITLEDGLQNVFGVLTLKTTLPNGEIKFNKVIKLR